MIPNYQITGQQVTPESIVDIIPEQESLTDKYKKTKKGTFNNLKNKVKKSLETPLNSLMVYQNFPLQLVTLYKKDKINIDKIEKQK